MQLTALVTKGITIADESIRIQLQDDESFSSFESKVQEACRYIDYRAHVQMQRLVEDTSLIEHLNKAEIHAVQHCAELLFPQQQLSAQPVLRSGVKFEFTKLFAASETLTVQVEDIDSYDSLNATIRNIWELLDIRLQSTNKRESDFRAYTTQLDYNTKLKVAMVIDLLYGKVSTDIVKARLTPEELPEQAEPSVEQYHVS